MNDDDAALADAVAAADDAAATLVAEWPRKDWSGLWRRTNTPPAKLEPGLSPQRVLADVARILELDVRTLRGRDRTARLVDARSVAALILRERCALSYPAIGRELARRHTTAMRALYRVTFRGRTRELAERVTRAFEERPPERAVVDVEAAFRQAREDAGGLASAQRDAPR